MNTARFFVTSVRNNRLINTRRQAMRIFRQVIDNALLQTTPRVRNLLLPGTVVIHLGRY